MRTLSHTPYVSVNAPAPLIVSFCVTDYYVLVQWNADLLASIDNARREWYVMCMETPPPNNAGPVCMFDEQSNGFSIESVCPELAVIRLTIENDPDVVVPTAYACALHAHEAIMRANAINPKTVVALLHDHDSRN